MNHAGTVTIVSCGIFSGELAMLNDPRLSECAIRMLDSMLHMHPKTLDERLHALISNLDDSSGILLVYGDCSPYIHRLGARPNVRKVRGINCCDIILGAEVYRSLRRQGAFFFLPEWTLRWQEVFRKNLGFEDPAISREFMREMHRKLVYLDTGIMPVPYSTLQDIERHFELDLEIRPTSLDVFSNAVRSGLEALH